MSHEIRHSVLFYSSGKYSIISLIIHSPPNILIRLSFVHLASVLVVRQLLSDTFGIANPWNFPLLDTTCTTKRFLRGRAPGNYTRFRLKPAQAEMIIVISLDGMRVKDYAQKIAITPKQVADRLSYAKKILRDDLMKR